MKINLFKWLTTEFFLLFAAALFLPAATTRAGALPTTAPRERKFAFEYKTTVKDIPAQAGRIEVWIPLPHDSPFQKITDLEIDSPYKYRISKSEYGNRILHLSLKEHKPLSFTITVRFNATRIEHLQERLQINDGGQTAVIKAPKEENDAKNMQRWLEPDKLVPIDGKVKEWAEEVVTAAGAKTDLEKARAIYNHIIATVKYDKSGKGWGRGDIYYACDARRGNCTDFHAIFIGYARALGIPARFAIGFPLPTDRGAGQISGYHCWAEFYLKDIGWVPVDASEAAKNPDKREYFFGAHDENRVEFSIGRDLVLSPKQKGEPLNYFVYPYVEVDGREFTSIDKNYSYKDLSEVAAK